MVEQPATTRRCNNCGVEHPLSRFRPYKGSSTAKYGKRCLFCRREDARRHYRNKYGLKGAAAGVRNHNAKLSPFTVRMIRASWRIPTRAIGALFGVSSSTISRARGKDTWAAVAGISTGKNIAMRDRKRNAERWLALRRMAGYFQDGSQTTVTLYQDDALRSCFIRVDDKTYGTDGSSFEGCIDQFIKEEKARETAQAHR